MVFHGTFPVFCFRVSSTPALLDSPEDALRLSGLVGTMYACFSISKPCRFPKIMEAS